MTKSGPPLSELGVIVQGLTLNETAEICDELFTTYTVTNAHRVARNHGIKIKTHKTLLGTLKITRIQ